jgi:hypothetical protein
MISNCASVISKKADARVFKRRRQVGLDIDTHIVAMMCGHFQAGSVIKRRAEAVSRNERQS